MRNTAPGGGPRLAVLNPMAKAPIGAAIYLVSFSCAFWYGFSMLYTRHIDSLKRVSLYLGVEEEEGEVEAVVDGEEGTTHPHHTQVLHLIILASGIPAGQNQVDKVGDLGFGLER